MLIDEFLPEYDFEEMHAVRVKADASKVLRVANEIDFGESWIVSWLLWLRGLPAENVTLRKLHESRFEKLGEIPDRELVLGLVGKFWMPDGELKKVDAAGFKKFHEAGFAKAVWNFAVVENHDRTLVTTETRIKCLDEESRWRFGFYWIFIRPFSGLIRTEMLRLIKQRAEGVG